MCEAFSTPAWAILQPWTWVPTCVTSQNGRDKVVAVYWHAVLGCHIQLLNLIQQQRRLDGQRRRLLLSTTATFSRTEWDASPAHPSVLLLAPSLWNIKLFWLVKTAYLYITTYCCGICIASLGSGFHRGIFITALLWTWNFILLNFGCKITRADVDKVLKLNSVPNTLSSQRACDPQLQKTPLQCKWLPVEFSERHVMDNGHIVVEWRAESVTRRWSQAGHSFPRQEESIFQSGPAEPHCLDWAGPVRPCQTNFGS